MISLKRKYLIALKKTKYLYFQNFPLVAFIFFVALLSVGLYSYEHMSWISYFSAFCLLIGSVIYYGAYFIKFRSLLDFHTQSKYHYDVFSFWGIIFFNMLFICCLAFVGLILDDLSRGLVFNEFGYEKIFLQMLQAVVDGGSFGFLDSFGIDICEMKFEVCELKPGTLGSTFTYTVSLAVGLAFWTSIVAELVEWIEAERNVRALLKIGKLKPEALTQEKIKRNQIILRHINEGKISITKHEAKLVNLLRESSLKDVRSIFLFIMQSTENMIVFQSCLDYFKRVKDKRFELVCTRIRHRQKRKLIEKYEFRKVKRKPLRARDKKE